MKLLNGYDDLHALTFFSSLAMLRSLNDLDCEGPDAFPNRYPIPNILLLLQKTKQHSRKTLPGESLILS